MDGSVQAWQMTCLCDGHNRGKHCTKELSVAKAGSEEMCLRMLKTWITISHRAASKDAHHVLFSEVEAMKSPTGFCLPGMAALDALAPASPAAMFAAAPAVVEAGQAAAEAAPHTAKRRRLNCKTDAS